MAIYRNQCNQDIKLIDSELNILDNIVCEIQDTLTGFNRDTYNLLKSIYDMKTRNQDLKINLRTLTENNILNNIEVIKDISRDIKDNVNDYLNKKINRLKLIQNDLNI